MVTTLAGDPNTSGDDYHDDDYSDGTGTDAEFDYPWGLAISGTSLYVADLGNNAIRVVDTGTAVVTTVAGVKGTSGTTDGSGTNARFDHPAGLAISGTSLYVADGWNDAIRVVDTGTAVVTTLTGGTEGTTDGTGTNARFNSPSGLAISGTSLYVAEYGNHAIRVVDTGTAVVTTVAGVKGTSGTTDGSGTNARFYYPMGLAISGTSLYVAEYGNHAIRVVDTGTAVVTTLAGVKGISGSGPTDGTGTNARFSYPAGLAISCNKLYVADRSNYALRVVDTETAVVTTVAGLKGTSGTTDGTGTNAQFWYPTGLLIDPADASTFYVTDLDLIRLVKY